MNPGAKRRILGCLAGAMAALAGAAGAAPPTPSLPITGPVTLRLTLPDGTPGTAEPLVATGAPAKGDTLFVYYDSPGQVRFGWESSATGAVFSSPLKASPGPHELLALMGSLIPPAPAGGGDPDPQLERLRGMFLLQLDGRPVLRAQGEFQAVPPAGRAALGWNSVGSAILRPFFSGVIAAAQAEPPRKALAKAMQASRWIPATADGTARYPGAVRLRLRLAPKPDTAADPLLVTGETGKGDLLYVRVVDPGHVVFGFDHWGVGGMVSPLLPIDLRVVHEVVLTMGDLFSPAGGAPEGERPVGVWLDGQNVLHGSSGFYRTPPEAIILGFNLIGGSTAGPYFRGAILETTAVSDAELTALGGAR